MKTRRWFVVMLVFLAATGCTAMQQVADNSSPAKIPALTSLQAAPSVTGAFATVAADQFVTPGAFMVLPSGMPNGLPRGAIKVFFTAPSLLALKVEVEGRALYKFADVPANLDPQVVGYYRVDSVDASDNWQVTIHPPLSPIPRFGLTINVATVSINPNYATGPDHESAPLVIKLSAKPFRIGLAQPMSGGACALVTNFPRLRPGLTVNVRDANTALIDFGGCCFGLSPHFSSDGKANSSAGAGFPFPGFREYSLVLRVGSQLAQGGFREKFTTNQAGPLEVCVNDDNLGDNSGGWGIDIRINE